MEKIKRLFLKDWQAKLGALICALILWFFITATQSSIVNFPGQIPVNFKNVNNGLIAISSDDVVKIKIRAENVNLSSVTEDNFEASVDLSNLTEGTYNKDIQVTSKNPNIQITNTTPKNTTIRIEKKIEKTVPVRVRLDGTASEGYGVSETEILPSEVRILGGESIVKNITEAVAPIRLNGENSNFSKNTQLFTYSASGQELKDVQIIPSEVSVNVIINRVGDVKTVGIKVNLTGSLSPGYWISTISTDPEVVSIGANASRIASVKYIETEPVDITNLSESKTVSAKLNLPTGITTEGNVMSVQVNLQIIKSDLVKEISVAPKFVNLKNGLKVSGATPEKVLVVLTGSKDVLSEINGESIELNIDLSGYNKGSNKITLTPSLLRYPSNLSFLNFVPESIVVSLVQN